MKTTNITDVEDPRKVRIAVYIRVSSHRQAIAGDSLAAQQNLIASYIESQKELRGWERVSVRHFVDLGKSATSMNRPALQRMLREVRSGTFTHVVAVKLDRVATSVDALLELVDTLKAHNTQLVTVKDSFDLTSPCGAAFVQIIAAFAKLERGFIAARTVTTVTENEADPRDSVLACHPDPDDRDQRCRGLPRGRSARNDRRRVDEAGSVPNSGHAASKVASATYGARLQHINLLKKSGSS